MAEKMETAQKTSRAENIKSTAEKVKEKIKVAVKTENRNPDRLPNRTKLLVSIVNQKDEVRLTEKSVAFSLFPESDEDRIMHAIREKMSLYLVGRGISFTIPLTGVSEIVANGLSSAATAKLSDRRKIMKSSDRKYDLIIASVEVNHVDEAMEAARNAGAAGGTIIRARNLDNAKAEQFIGISLMEERELLLILTKKEGKLAIMETLTEKVGLKTEAGGIIFSLPVDKTAGISVADEEEQSGREGSDQKDAQEPNDN